jgi:hypothetical protein
LHWPQTWAGRILHAGLSAGVLVCVDHAGPRNAGAFEVKQEIKIKPVSVTDWFSIKVDGNLLNLNSTSFDTLTAYGLKTFEPVQMEKGAVMDARVTLGVWDDWVRLTSRQATSSYITPGTDLGYFRQTGLGFENAATSQRIETAVWKADSMRLSVFADYARVGAYFMAPESAIKRQDPFSKPNSTTTRFGGTVEQGPITFTLEQRAQRSLAQENAPVLVQNQIGVSLSFDEMLGRSDRTHEGISWVVPSAVWFNVGQGRMRASLSQGVAGDTTSDVSAGLSWNLGKIYANLGYWQSEYQSQLYPWKGSGINGSLGLHEGQWGIDMYFNVVTSATSYTLAVQPSTIPAFSLTSGLLLRTSF